MLLFCSQQEEGFQISETEEDKEEVTENSVTNNEPWRAWKIRRALSSGMV
jgi:hypothetical protein